MIETNYNSLSEIDEAIKHYYSEVIEEKVIGYETDAVDENGMPTGIPIKEVTVKVVLNQPDQVTYQDVMQRRGERKSWESVVKDELRRAIKWEEFDVNHNQYLEWKEAYKAWEAEQPTEEVFDEDTQEYIEKVVDAPVKPEVTLDARREVYEVITESFDANYEVSTGENTESFDDELFARVITPVTQTKSDNEIMAYHSSLAIQERYDAVYAPINHNENAFQVGKGKDGIYGIDNFKGKLIAALANPELENQVFDWIDEDNNIVTLTLADVRVIVAEFDARQQKVMDSYNAWRISKVMLPFFVE